MDNSWRLEFGGLSILIDPWLQGAEVDYFPWFNKQWHRTQPLAPAEVGSFDLVLITQKYPDHFHAETLEALRPGKLIVPQSIEKAVRKILPEAEVTIFNDSPRDLLGSGINLHHLPTRRKMDPIYDGLVLENGRESVLIASHGVNEAENWTEAILQLPPVKLAFTPFNTYKLPFFLGGTVSPGLDAVRKLIEAVKPERVVATHDEDKHAKGLVSKFARVTIPPSANDLRKDSHFQNRLLHIDNYQIHSI